MELLGSEPLMSEKSISDKSRSPEEPFPDVEDFFLVSLS